MKSKQRNILLGAAAVVLIGVLSYSSYISQTKNVEVPNKVVDKITAKTELYKNDKYKFEMQRPSSWKVADGDRNVAFTFKTEDGHDAELMIDTFGPMKLTSGWMTKNTLQIGDEKGYRDSSYHCGDGTPNGNKCTGVIMYRTPKMFNKGFNFEFHIIGVDAIKITEGQNDPAVLFPNDVATLDKIMQGFKFTE